MKVGGFGEKKNGHCSERYLEREKDSKMYKGIRNRMGTKVRPE